jgi:hypothetical protein
MADHSFYGLEALSKNIIRDLIIGSKVMKTEATIFRSGSTVMMTSAMIFCSLIDFG